MVLLSDISPTVALGGQAICAKMTLVPGTKPHENYSINSDRTNDSNYRNRIDGNLWLTVLLNLAFSCKLCDLLFLC